MFAVAYWYNANSAVFGVASRYVVLRWLPASFLRATDNRQNIATFGSMTTGYQIKDQEGAAENDSESR